MTRNPYLKIRRGVQNEDRPIPSWPEMGLAFQRDHTHLDSGIDHLDSGIDHLVDDVPKS